MPSFLTILAAALSLPAYAGTYLVDSTLDEADADLEDGQCKTLSDTCTLRAAIQEANATYGAAEIEVPAGIYILSITNVAGVPDDAQGDLDIRGDLTIRGAGPTKTIIDANRIDRVMEVGRRTGTDLVMLGLTLRNGVARSRGGGLNNREENNLITLYDVHVVDNEAGYFGGGIRNLEGEMILDKVQILNNHSGWIGGGLGQDEQLNTVIRDSLIQGNTAGQDGGGLYNGTFVISNTRILKNFAERDGGGIYASQGNVSIRGIPLELNKSTVAENIAGRNGGGIYTRDGHIVRDSKIVGNRAGAFGGGMSFAGGVLERSLIYRNVAYNDGGLSGGRDGVITNVTVSSNAAMEGGGMVLGGAMRLRNVTVAFNRSETGGAGLFLGGDDDIQIENSLVANNLGSPDCVTRESSRLQIQSGGTNLDSDGSCGFSHPDDLPATDPLLSPTLDNGGSLQTHELLPGSPAIDAGPESCGESDQTGSDRVVDGDGDGIDACDIGAYEVTGLVAPNPAPRPIPSLGWIGTALLVIIIAATARFRSRAKSKTNSKKTTIGSLRL